MEGGSFAASARQKPGTERNERAWNTPARFSGRRPYKNFILIQKLQCKAGSMNLFSPEVLHEFLLQLFFHDPERL